ncbi:MAG: glucose-6-phosphate dehydrogenase [bacterium]
MLSTNKTNKNELIPPVLVIFGITGDLAKKKLLPAIYHLIKDNLLPEGTTILGLTRQNLTDKDILSNVEVCVNEEDGICDPIAIKKLRDIMQVVQIDISKLGEFKKLKSALELVDKKANQKLNRLYYMSVPPNVTANIVSELGRHGLNKENSRLLIEKPFGFDYQSAKNLIKVISKFFTEDQIFRIDHYLAKETVQNILVFRRNNIFEKIWNSDNISSITITANEELDIEGRKVFYEETGALRDLIQSHLLMLLGITILDLPESMTSQNLHKAKLKALESISPITNSEIKFRTVRGQYVGYRSEVDNPKSNIDTFAAIKLSVATKRWHKVEFILKTGKALSEKLTTIEVQFKPNKIDLPHNSLIFRIQPHEDIKLKMYIKEPGFNVKTKITNLNLNYREEDIDVTHPDAYERVLVDSVKGDHSLFSTSSEILASWKIVNNVVKSWIINDNDLIAYKKGSTGPDISILSK